MTIRRLSAILLFIIATVFCALFALGAINPSPVERRSNWPDSAGNIWTGDYLASENRYLGNVIIEFPDGSVYEGGYLNGHFNGPGRYSSSAGWQIEGDFVDGRLTE